MSITPERERIIKLSILGVIELLPCAFLLPKTLSIHAWKLNCVQPMCPGEMGATLLPNTLLYWGYALMLTTSYVFIVQKNSQWAWYVNIVLLVLFVPFVFIAANI